MAISLSDPQQRNKLLIGLMPLVVLGMYWYMFYGKSTAEIAELQTHYEEIDGKNTKAKAIAAKGGPELKKKLAIYEQHMIRLEELIPKSEEVPQLLHTMTLRAEEAGVDLTMVKPEKEEPGQFYTKQSYAMSVVGPYHAVGRFLGAVGSLPRIITPVDVKVNVRPDLMKDGQQKLDATFNIQTYVVPSRPKTPAGPPVPPPGAAKPHA